MTAPMHGSATVVANIPLARDTYCLRLRDPMLAAAIQPGQFVMLRLPGTTDPLLGRPFALFDTILDEHELPAAIDIGYQVVGKLTSIMSSLRPDDMLNFWGPLGNGFPDLHGVDHVGLVAGGIGQTPFLAYARQLLGQRSFGGKSPKRAVQRVSLYYGVRSADLLAGVAEFEQAGVQVHLATDDGSRGFHGFVTQLLEQHEKPQQLIGCGPEPMMKALAILAQRWGVPCLLSLETPMACGIGICFSCVTKVRTLDGWDYRRVCVDGPIFDAAGLCWETNDSKNDDDALVRENVPMDPGKEWLARENERVDPDKEWVVNENIRLRQANRLWKAVAIAGLIILLAVLVPFTVYFYRAARYYQISAEAQKNMIKLLEHLHEKAKSHGK